MRNEKTSNTFYNLSLNSKIFNVYVLIYLIKKFRDNQDFSF